MTVRTGIVMRGDPLAPPEGEAAQGERPLDPLWIFGVFKVNLLRGYRQWGMPEAAGAKPPRAWYDFDVSAEQKNSLHILPPMNFCTHSFRCSGGSGTAGG
jgi:hypothetical protein